MKSTEWHVQIWPKPWYLIFTMKFWITCLVNSSLQLMLCHAAISSLVVSCHTFFMVDERKTSVHFEVKGQASKSQLDLVKNQISQKLYFVLSEILQRGPSWLLISNSVDSHLQKLAINRRSIENECALIKMRAGLFNEDDETRTICPKHRYYTIHL